MGKLQASFLFQLLMMMMQCRMRVLQTAFSRLRHPSTQQWQHHCHIHQQLQQTQQTQMLAQDKLAALPAVHGQILRLQRRLPLSGRLQQQPAAQQQALPLQQHQQQQPAA